MKGQLTGVAAKASIEHIEAADVVVSQRGGKGEATLLILGLLRDGVAEEDHLAIGTMFCKRRMGCLLVPLHSHVSSLHTLTKVGRILVQISTKSTLQQRGCPKV